MNLQRIVRAVIDRINADVGLATSGVYAGQVPDFPSLTPTANPYIVISFSGAASQGDSGGSVVEFTFELTIVGHRNSETDDVVWMARDRLYGNAGPGNDFAPTYGLHSHNLVVTSAADTVALTLLYVDEATIGTDDPDNLVAHSMRFRVLVRSE